MGAGLLANTVGQCHSCWLAHRIREQARSHRVLKQPLHMRRLPHHIRLDIH